MTPRPATTMEAATALPASSRSTWPMLSATQIPPAQIPLPASNDNSDGGDSGEDVIAAGVCGLRQCAFDRRTAGPRTGDAHARRQRHHAGCFRVCAGFGHGRADLFFCRAAYHSGADHGPKSGHPGFTGRQSGGFQRLGPGRRRPAGASEQSFRSEYAEQQPDARPGPAKPPSRQSDCRPDGARHKQQGAPAPANPPAAAPADQADNQPQTDGIAASGKTGAAQSGKFGVGKGQDAKDTKAGKTDDAKSQTAATDDSQATSQSSDAKAQAPQDQTAPATSDTSAPKPVQTADANAASMAITAPQAQTAQRPRRLSIRQACRSVPSSRTPDVPALAVEIAARSQSGAKQFDIRLDPPELGRVEVRLSIDATGKAEAHLTADQPETLDLLQKDSRTLTQRAARCGPGCLAERPEFLAARPGPQRQWRQRRSRPRQQPQLHRRQPALSTRHKRRQSPPHGAARPTAASISAFKDQT